MFLRCLHQSISQWSKCCRRKLENLTLTSASIAMCVTDHLSVCTSCIQFHMILSSECALFDSFFLNNHVTDNTHNCLIDCMSVLLNSYIMI